jgi:hypothetical protein
MSKGAKTNRPEGPRGDFSVVLAHGPGDAAAAASVVEELRSRRQAVIPVVVESSDAPLLEVCAKLGGHGLFVIARGAALGADRTEALREVLRDLGVPMTRSLGLAFGASPKMFVDRVVTVLGRITGGTVEMRVLGGPPRPPTPPKPTRSEPSTTQPASFAVVPPSFDAPVETPVPARPDNHSTVISVDAPTIAIAPARRRAAAATAVLAAASALVWFVVSRGVQDEAESIADEPAAPTTTAAATPSPIATPAPTPAAPAPVAVAPTEAAAPAVEDSETIVAALKKREIRALDVFVVSPEAKKAADFAGASAYCASLNVAGIGEWRLPDIGELLSMSRAKMVRKGSFWSATKGDTFGDLRLVLVIKRERISAIPSGWDGGRVRERG